MNHLIIGICAHVDAGKTTLSEGLLYLGGSIRKMGRVDNRDAFLDTDEMERARGITIFSKQAQFERTLADGTERMYTLLDTPGHADFSPEMERTLQVLDLAVLVISAADGVNAQVRMLWSLLEHYGVPTVIFVNKMDQMEAIGEGESRRAEVFAEIQEKLGGNAVDFDRIPYPDSSAGESSEKGGSAFDAKSSAAGGSEDGPAIDADTAESIALCDEELLDAYMDGREITWGDIRKLIAERKLFPVLTGSALRMNGVDRLLACLDMCAAPAHFSDEFSARVFKITRDGRERLTWMKITGGSLKVRDVLSYSGRGENFISGSDESPEETDSNEKNEKITQIRLYSGEKFTALPEAEAGSVVAVCGLTDTYAGQGLGAAQTDNAGLVVPILTWQILLPQGTDPYRAYRDLCILEEEEPMLSVRYNERKKEITVSLMGEIQREILKNLAMQRFGLEINYGRPSIIYKETIRRPVEGVGHFEPLRHYAEVHLLLEPGEPGSGLVFESMCTVDTLAKNWQRLVLTHLRERKHRGVLTGSEITDMKITLIGGRAHEKHTEGGDFRQATYRAVRQGLMMAENILLEPFYSFRMELPGTALGRALADLQQMGASFSQPDFSGDNAILTGEAPVSVFGDYAETLSAYTKGQGHLLTEMGGYRPCKDPDAVIEEIGYDPDSDKRNPASSVFCSNGAGVIVPWYEVREYMHVDTGWREGAAFTGPAGGKNQVSRAGAGSSFFEKEESDDRPGTPDDDMMEAGYRGAEGRRAAAKKAGPDERSFKEREADRFAAEGELMAIFERTYGPIKDRSLMAQASPKKVTAEPAPKYRKPKKQPDKEYLLVDGYNIIFAWEELRKLASGDMKAARDRLLEILSNYAGYVKRNVICVFDAYKVAGGQERVYRHHNIDVIFTREAETADLYIERAAHELSRQYRVTVATSDAVEQVIIYGAGALRLSAQNFLEEVKEAEREMKTTYVAGENGKIQKIGTNLGEELKGILEEN